MERNICKYCKHSESGPEKHLKICLCIYGLRSGCVVNELSSCKFFERKNVR